MEQAGKLRNWYRKERCCWIPDGKEDEDEDEEEKEEEVTEEEAVGQGGGDGREL